MYGSCNGSNDGFFATLLVFKVKGESFFKGAMVLLYLISGIAVGFIFKFFYARGMVLFLGAMMAVDTDLYEAASLDGANKWHQFKYIILPGIKSIVVLNLILSISGSLSAFELPYVITNGTMGTGTYFVIMNRLALPESWLYLDNFKVAFEKGNMLRCFGNTALILLVVLTCSVFIGSMLAYVLNRFSFKGNRTSWG